MPDLLDLMEGGRSLAQAGIAAAAAHSGQPWQDSAFASLQSFIASAQARPLVFMAEQARSWAEKRGLAEPPDPRAWGAVMQRAKREGLIHGAGYAESMNPEAHCRPTRLWRAL